MAMASSSAHEARNDLQPKNENERQDVGEDTATSPHMDKTNYYPPMNQGSNDPTHSDEGLDESPQTDHDDIEHRLQSEGWWGDYSSTEDEDEDSYYWAKEYVGHLWKEKCGWSVFKPWSPPEPWWIEDPPPRSPSDPDYLCNVCRHINFCWLLENNMPKRRFYGEREISIGTVGRVLKQADCSFCMLLASNFRKDETKDVTVHVESGCFSEQSTLDCNHPETEVKYLSIRMAARRIHLQALDDSQPMRGRQITPYIKQQRQNIARQWLEKCEHEHCNDEDAGLVPNLALIDLKQRCIVRPHGPVRYAALSYVWGKSPQKMYSTTTQQEFETKGALHSKQGFLPQTITDAMDLAAHIGLDYLWVDSLCILQDDEANRDYFISRMGTIYSTSVITIVDANGDHAGSGLIGMSSPRKPRSTATVQGMQLCATTCSLDRPWKEYDACAWVQRGWTYQEMLLSKRLLLVTRARLQFVCNHTVYLEETHPHSPRTSDWTMPTLSTVPICRSAAVGDSNLHLYDKAVQKFTKRDLTYELDVIPAFDAVFKALHKGTSAKSLFNLPDVEIEETLLWKSHDHCYFGSLSGKDWSRVARRRYPDQLPSWSWAGWRGQIRYDRYTPLIWKILWRDAPTSAADKCSEFTLQDYRCRNWREKGWHYKYLSDEVCHVYTHDSRPNIRFQNPIALEPDTRPHRPSFLDDSNVLHFSAFSVHISASTVTSGLHLDSREEILINRHVLDSSQSRAGSIILDCWPAKEVSLRLVALARCSEWNMNICEEQLGVDLRNIAPLDWNPEYFNNISPPNDVDEPPQKYHDFNAWNHKRFQQKFYSLYTVLLVEMKEGIAYRIGIGEVHIDAFHAANPVWEEVRLG